MNILRIEKIKFNHGVQLFAALKNIVNFDNYMSSLEIIERFV